tara:strand:+ start:1716 stop:2759 length:1044 start_codon:yes stop_codon:yes gene_type:complete
VKFSKTDFHYELPSDLVAQYPSQQRTESKTLILDNQLTIIDFNDTLKHFAEYDLVVLNETKVRPARLSLQKDSGGDVEILILKKTTKYRANCLARGLNRKKTNQTLYAPKFPVKIKIISNASKNIEIEFNQDIDQLCKEIGHMPIPPYLGREAEELDVERYQTVFANDKRLGSAAAPTASLHMDDAFLKKVEQETQVCKLNLNVGYGTFEPLADGLIDSATKLHEEDYYISANSADLINNTLENKGKVLSVGTTTLRALESAFDQKSHKVISGHQSTDIFISPGYRFKVVDGLVTNFHLPESSLLMLVAAFAGKDNIMKAYKHAVQEKMRFFSYGDAMIIKQCLSKS